MSTIQLCTNLGTVVAFSLMRAASVFVGVIFLAGAMAEQPSDSGSGGTIYGVARGPDGQPAKAIGLTASPLGVPLAAVLPRTRTNDKGEYRFEKIAWWGRYAVYADDERAGYSAFSTGPSGDPHPPEVEITPEHREAELNIQLPPKAGFLEIRLTNRKTGAAISALSVALAPLEHSESMLFSQSSYSDRVVLIPPDRDLLLHVTSDGFKEWEESVGKGKHIRLQSGTRLVLVVQLEPSN
jgi:hypothetical protein